ncbi:iron export ABC transporter permease subunit FetB [Synechococcus moorigangaii CMS01]|nr:iron export ABC transporter permease subunit FetB [Synechococcus moorigangaii CMS01]
MGEFVALDPGDLVWALGLIALAIALSRWQRLNLEGELFLATGRTILQLLVVGYSLELVFALANPFLVLGIVLVMLTIAAIAARNRINDQVKFPLIWGSIFASVSIPLAYTLLVIVQPDTWYDPQYLIPLAGMVMGNAMNSASLAGERLSSRIKSSRLEIETQLCLGATPKQAIAIYRTEAIRASLIPTINSMMVVGLVSLPGMFTGQVLSGIDPLNAASYQILILFLIVTVNIICTSLVTEGLYRQFFNPLAQLRP